ncbi:MAG: ABC transporter permease [Chloroflexota bacterium]
MLFKVLFEALRRRKRRVMLAVLSVGVGASLATALFALSANVADNVGRELRAYGANILISASEDGQNLGVVGLTQSFSQGTINENDLYKLKTIFWRNNVLGLAPYLSLMASAGEEPIVVTGTWFEKELTLPKGARVRSTYQGQTEIASEDRFKTGVKTIAPWWRVEGRWVADSDTRGALVGATIAERLGLRAGDTLTVSHDEHKQQLQIEGILSTGGLEENQVFVNLPVAQALRGISSGADRVLVSALVTPKDKIPSSIRGKRPEEMTPREYETWYCTPLLDSIALQIEEALPGTDARAVRQISEAEGAFAVRIESLLALVTAVALATSALGVTATMTATVMERRGEIGVMKAVGADDIQVATLFLAEAVALGLLGGLLGYFLGLQLAELIGRTVFAMGVQPTLTYLPATLALAVVVALLGAALPVRTTVRIQPIILLKGN